MSTLENKNTSIFDLEDLKQPLELAKQDIDRAENLIKVKKNKPINTIIFFKIF